MCIGVPSKVLAVDGLTATVDSLGQQRQVSLVLLAEPPLPGEYLMIQAGGFAAHVLTEADAEQTLSALTTLQIVEKPATLLSARTPEGDVCQ